MNIIFVIFIILNFYLEKNATNAKIKKKEFKRQNQSKRIKKTQEEIAIENQINALRQRLAIVRSQRQNQSQSQNQPIIRNDQTCYISRNTYY